MSETTVLTETPELNPQAFADSIAVMRSGDFEVSAEGQEVAIGRVLGGGGTKTVYDASLAGESFALALPNLTDGVDKAYKKWEAALKEPAATEAMRSIGLIVNPCCEIMPVAIGEKPFPAIRMTRYQDLPIQVRDSKNRNSSIVEQDLLPVELDDKSFSDSIVGVREDIATLIKQGVSIGRDSFNLCLSDGKLRLYLNDLAGAELNAIEPEEVADYVQYYAMHAIGAVMNGLSHDEFTRHKEFLREGRLADSLAQQVTLELSDANSSVT